MEIPKYKSHIEHQVDKTRIEASHVIKRLNTKYAEPRKYDRK